MLLKFMIFHGLEPLQKHPKRALQLAYDHKIRRVPTLIVANHVLGIEEERIKGDKKIVQNIHRLLKKYWEKLE